MSIYSILPSGAGHNSSAAVRVKTPPMWEPMDAPIKPPTVVPSGCTFETRDAPNSAAGNISCLTCVRGYFVIISGMIGMLENCRT
ncbi:hypothetical protein PMAYCL1PPCAC_09167, partial [Pristionchus mayeri]